MTDLHVAGPGYHWLQHGDCFPLAPRHQSYPRTLLCQLPAPRGSLHTVFVPLAPVLSADLPWPLTTGIVQVVPLQMLFPPVLASS